MNKKITIINQDSGYLMIDIANAYAEAGYEVSLIAGRLVQRSKPLNQKIKYDKIIKYNRSNSAMRIYTWLIAFIQIIFKVWFKHRGSHLFIVSNPPFAPLIPLFCKNSFSLLIFDIYPDALSELGFLSKKSMIIHFWKKANKKVYPRAEYLFTLTEGMKEVLESYAGNKEIKVVPIWTDNKFLRPIKPVDNPFIIKHNLSDKFIVLYSGNIGLSGDVDILVNIAAEIKRDDIVFVIIGDGAKKEQIIQKVALLKLENVLLLPLQPVKDLPYSLSSASLAVVSLGKTASKLAIPSKLFNYLSVGAPLLCMTAKDSEVDRLVLKYKCGGSFEPDNISEIIKYIIEIANNHELHSTMQLNSLKASKDFNADNAIRFLPESHIDLHK